MGRFIRELDVCVRWQVAWQGRERQKEKLGIYADICMQVVFFFFSFSFPGKHICLGPVDCLAAGGGKSAGTS